MVIWGKALRRHGSRARHFLGILIVGMLAGLSLPGAKANAHAIIVSSEPASGTVVTGPDVAFVLHFNSRIDHQRSRLMLKQPDGTATPVPVAPPEADQTVMTARVVGLIQGAYSLHWQVLSIDGHLTRGDIPFTVGPATAGRR